VTDDHTTLITDVWPPIAERWNAQGFRALSPQEQSFARVWMLVAEVENGGLAQYLFNSHGGEGLLAIEGLRQIGASQLADDLRVALAALPGGRPAATQDERQAQIDALDPDAEVLERFDHALCAAERHLRNLMLAFARQHFVTQAS
jgi:Domain of unknown function (DUF4375)